MASPRSRGPRRVRRWGRRLSDIHGNLRALEAVFGDLRRRGPRPWWSTDGEAEIAELRASTYPSRSWLIKVHRRAESVRPLELDPPATGDADAAP